MSIEYKNRYKNLAKDISKIVKSKFNRKKCYHPDKVYVKQYDDLVIQIKYVGYTYIDVTIWKSYKIIAFWTICSDGYIMQFKYDENIFTRYTLKPFLLDKSL